MLAATKLADRERIRCPSNFYQFFVFHSGKINKNIDNRNVHNIDKSRTCVCGVVKIINFTQGFTWLHFKKYIQEHFFQCPKYVKQSEEIKSAYTLAICMPDFNFFHFVFHDLHLMVWNLIIASRNNLVSLNIPH